jgi:hypothetical protein
MKGRRRIVALTALGLAVPTFALGGEPAPPGPASLNVSASLGGCGLADTAIVCRIDASWDAPEGAEYYTVSVTRADGSVVDLGQSSGTSRSIYVPYVGPGTYSVRVAAWGTPPGEEEPEVLVREQALSTGGDAVRTEGGEPTVATPPGESREDGAVAEGPADTGDHPDASPPAGEPEPCAEEPVADPAAEEEVEPLAAEEVVADAEQAAAEEAPAPTETDDPIACP